MIKTLSNIFKQDKEKFVIPRSVQQVIPIETIWSDGIFKIGRNKFARTYKFTDINYAVASKVDKETMFLEYMDLLNSFDCGGTTKITINNRRLNKVDFEKAILIPMQEDGLDLYRKEYNNMLLDKATSSNSMVQEKYVTVSCYKKTIEEARTYFARVTTELNSHFARLGSKCAEVNGEDKLRILHDFYRTGEESGFHFDIQESMRKGHSFKDYICPDTFEFEKDYFRMGDRYGRVLFLREYASYIKDDMIAELTDMNRNLMLSIDVIPVPTDEAVQEVEKRLLGVETNITNWQRRQNANNNFSAVIPYDLEQQRKESKEFMDDLTTRDQRMMFGILTMVHTAESKKQLDADTETLLTIGRKKLCQFSVLKFQQMDGLNTALPIGHRKIPAVRTLTSESVSDLMSQISFVTQNTFLFKKSIRENIMMGNPEATEEEMMQAAKDAICHDFIMRLPKGYDTVIDKETKLSGGEKQRITLARAILKNAPVVILDEATAYIDADNEDLLQKALAKLSEEKTVLVIAHRLSSIKEADSIVVLEQGEVIDCGTHDELINRCFPYRDMWAAFEQSDQWKMGGVNA